MGQARHHYNLERYIGADAIKSFVILWEVHSVKNNGLARVETTYLEDTILVSSFFYTCGLSSNLVNWLSINNWVEEETWCKIGWGLTTIQRIVITFCNTSWCA